MLQRNSFETTALHITRPYNDPRPAAWQMARVLIAPKYPFSSRSQHGLMVRVLAYGPKGPGFNSQQFPGEGDLSS